MKAKYHIYNYLLFLSLVVLFAGSMVGCSNDPVMKEETTSGKTMLSITVRGITITKPTDGNYDDYIETLRIIGYDDAGNAVCNIKYNDLPENSNVKKIINQNEETFYQISNLELQGFAGGRCHFYFIANEDDYNYTISLGNGITDAPDKSNLEGAKVSFNANTNLGTFPILMTAKLVALVKNGIEQEITEPIQLVRCVAKFKLIINGAQNTYTIGKVTVTGYYPQNYALWEGSRYTGYSTSAYNKSVTNNNSSDSKCLFSSSEIYFPEKLYGSQIDYSGLLRFNIPVTRNGILKTYEVEIGDDVDNGNYNIQRNTIYTIIANLGWTPTFTVQVNSWNEKTMEIPAFE